jgi:Cu-Zn family superoxide dismutase
MKRLYLLSLLTILFILLGCNEIKNGNDEYSTSVKKALAVIHPLDDSNVNGIVYFTKVKGIIEITADIDGLEPGKHGFHIHEFGDLRTNGKDLLIGSHYNPLSGPHADESNASRHVGDLGNILALNDSTAIYKRNNFMFSIDGEYPILGRTVAIHKNEDDLKTQPSGASGEIIAVGIIGIANTDYQN